MRAVAAYVRMSTDLQVDSPETQLGIIMEYAAKNELEVVAAYSDEAVSGGKSIAGRPGFKQLLSERKTKGFDAIIIVRLDRLSRNMLDFMQFEQEAAKHGLEIIYATEHYSNDASGWLLKHINVLFAHHTRTITGERTKEKCRQLAAKGQWPSGYPPLGFAYNKTTKILSVDTERAPDVIAVFQIYIEAQGSYSHAARLLNGRGILTQRGNLWRDDGVAFILKNPIYRGRIHYADIDLPSDTVPIIIPPDLLAQVDQMIDNTRGKRKRAGQSVYTYSSLLICSQCGYTYKVARTCNGYEQYICRGRKERGVCDAPKLQSTWLDRLVPVGFQDALTRELAFLDTETGPDDAIPEDHTKPRRIANLRAVAKRKQEMYAHGIIVDIGQLKTELAAIDTEIAELSSRTDKPAIFSKAELQNLATNFDEYWESLQTPMKHALLLAISPRIHVYSLTMPRKIILDTILSCGKIEVEEK